MTRIPAEELALLEQTVREADELARDGQVMRGYDLLDMMLSWAETPALDPDTGHFAAPEPWSGELVNRHRSALVAYSRAHGVVFSLPDPTPLTLPERVAASLDRSRRLCATSELLRRRSQAVRQHRR